MEFRIRQANENDVPAIVSIECKTSPEPWSEAALYRDVVENGQALVIVAELEDRVVGYADVWQVADEFQLNNIAVVEELRGNHIAENMLEVLIATARELKMISITLEVRESNTPARKLYEKCGFTIVGERAGYYCDNGEKAVLMDKLL